MKKEFLSFLILVTLTFFLLSCGKATTQEFTKTQNGITAVFTMKPTSPVTMKLVTLTLTLTDSKGKAIEGADVVYDLIMPGMTMPPNQPQATDKGKGIYQVDTTFTMSGKWSAETTVTYTGVTTPFTFDFSVK